MPNETKPPLPWFQIECEVRAGLIPVNKIAKKYGCSHTAIYKHCKKYKIRRDLRKPIRDAVVRESAKEIVTLGRRGSYKSTKDTAELVANAHKPDEQQKLVDAVAIEIQQLLASHREGIRRLRELEFKLIERIYGDPKKEWVGQFKGEIITHQQDIPATELAQAASALANVQTKRIQLERQAFGILNEVPNDDKEYRIHVIYDRGPEGHGYKPRARELE